MSDTSKFSAGSNLAEDKLFQVLLAPVVTEKSTRAAEQGGQVVFHVLPLSLIHI